MESENHVGAAHCPRLWAALAQLRRHNAAGWQVYVMRDQLGRNVVQAIQRDRKLAIETIAGNQLGRCLQKLADHIQAVEELAELLGGAMYTIESNLIRQFLALKSQLPPSDKE